MEIQFFQNVIQICTVKYLQMYLNLFILYGRWPLLNLGYSHLANTFLMSVFWVMLGRRVNVGWWLSEAWSSGLCHDLNPFPGTISNPFKRKYSFPLGGKVQDRDPKQALRHFFRISGSLSIPLIWFLSPSLDASLTDAAAAFWSTQTSPLRGETLKWLLKLHCNHTQLKTTRKCLPYASKPSVCVWASRRGIIDKSGRAWIEELSGGWLLLAVSVIRSVRATQLSVCPVFDKCLMQHRP